jgi:hypothetical protein
MATSQTVSISDDGKISIGKATQMPGPTISDKHMNEMMNKRLTDAGYGDKPQYQKPGPCCDHK